MTMNSQNRGVTDAPGEAPGPEIKGKDTWKHPVAHTLKEGDRWDPRADELLRHASETAQHPAANGLANSMQSDPPPANGIIEFGAHHEDEPNEDSDGIVERHPISGALKDALAADDEPSAVQTFEGGMPKDSVEKPDFVLDEPTLDTDVPKDVPSAVAKFLRENPSVLKVEEPVPRMPGPPDPPILAPDPPPAVAPASRPPQLPKPTPAETAPADVTGGDPVVATPHADTEPAFDIKSIERPVTPIAKAGFVLAGVGLLFLMGAIIGVTVTRVRSTSNHTTVAVSALTRVVPPPVPPPAPPPLRSASCVVSAPTGDTTYTTPCFYSDRRTVMFVCQAIRERELDARCEQIARRCFFRGAADRLIANESCLAEQDLATPLPR
jgi:hypothetical protein